MDERRAQAEALYNVPAMIDPETRDGFRAVAAKARSLESVIEDLAQHIWRVMHRDTQHYMHACEQIPHDLHDAVADLWDEVSGFRDAEAPLLRLVRNINLGLGTGVVISDAADIPGWLLEAELRAR